MIALALLFACSGEGEEVPACDLGADPTLEIGDGQNNRYQEVGEGGTMSLIHGPQGGWHVEIGLRGAHLDVSDLVSGSVEGFVDGELVACSTPWLTMRCNGDLGQDSFGTLLVFGPEGCDGNGMDFTELDGKEVEIRATVEDAAGNTASAVTHIILDDVTL